MSAEENLNEVQFKVRKGKRQGVSHTTISARQGDRELGYARLTDHASFLDTLEVRPGARGQGLGHALMDQVTQRFGGNTLRLHAAPFGKSDGPDQQGLMKLYGAHGFEPDTNDGHMIRRPPAK